MFCEKVVSTSTPEKPYEILCPVSGQTYSPYNPWYLITRFDTDSFNGPRWYFSLDNGKKWNEIYDTSNTKEDKVYSKDIGFGVQQWTPALFGLTDTVIMVRVYAYPGQKFATVQNVRIKQGK